jgi:hypothetical protein
MSENRGVEMKGWLHRQDQRRRFFILWAFMAAILAGTQITVCLIVTASIHAHVLHWPPMWVFGIDILGSPIPAAIQSRAGQVAR